MDPFKIQLRGVKDRWLLAVKLDILKLAQLLLYPSEEYALTQKKSLLLKNERSSCSIRGINGTS